MRIISGSARGRRLFTPQTHSKAIRPTADRAREALFNIFGLRVNDSFVLDLFAGTGAFGCEALSRGAAHVAFVDKSRVSLELIDKNINLIPEGANKSTIFKFDLSKGITESFASHISDYPFDLVFADPPYLTHLSTTILSTLDKCCVLSEDPLIIIEERKNFNLPDKFDNLQRIDTRLYGESSFFFYAKNKK